MVKLPYKENRCYEEKLTFMAEGSPGTFEIYKIKKKSEDGYEMGRYHKGIMYHYTTLSVENVKERDWSEVECPDKKEIKLFVTEE